MEKRGRLFFMFVVMCWEGRRREFVFCDFVRFRINGGVVDSRRR